MPLILLLTGLHSSKKLTVFCFLASLSFSKAQTSIYNSSHTEGFKAIEAAYYTGENTTAVGLNAIYYIIDNLHVKGFVQQKKFDYKTYNEDILETGLEAGMTVLEGYSRGRFSLFGFFNITITAGVSTEIVKVKSKTTLINDYPKHLFLTGGTIIEYAASERIGLTISARQLYAINGDKNKLGYVRYDLGFGLRYYLFE